MVGITNLLNRSREMDLFAKAACVANVVALYVIIRDSWVYSCRKFSIYISNVFNIFLQSKGVCFKT